MMTEEVRNPQNNLKDEYKPNLEDISTVVSQDSYLRDLNTDSVNFNFSELKVFNDSKIQNRQVAIISNQPAVMISKDENSKNLQQIMASMSYSVINFAQKNKKQEQHFQYNLQKTKVDAELLTQKGIQLISGGSRNFQTMEQYKKEVLQILSIRGDATNSALFEHAKMQTKIALQHQKQMEHLCTSNMKYFQAWQKIQQKINNKLEKDIQLTQDAFYKNLKAINKKKQTQIAILLKQSEKNEKIKQNEQKTRTKQYENQLKLINTKVKNQQQRQKCYKQAEQALKKTQEQDQSRNKDRLLQLQKKQMNIKIEAQAKQNNQKLLLQKNKTQLQLKKQQQINRQAMIQKEYDDSVELYKLQMEEANRFIASQQRLGRGYTWGNTPPAIMTEKGQRYVKRGTVWYRGK